MRSNLSSRLSRLAIALLAVASVWGAQAQTYQLKQWVVDIKPTYSTTARWEPQTVNMGSVLLHQTAQQSVTLFNDGNATANFSSLSGTGSGISVDAAQCAAVAAGSSCAVTLTFSPLVDGVYSLTGIKPVATGSMPLLATNTLSVSGVGVHGIVSASVPSLTFGSLPVASTSVAQAVTLTNTGTASLAFTVPNGISVDTGASDFNQSNDCASLAIGGTCTVHVAFTPAAPGTRLGSVLLADDGGGATHLTLNGTGVFVDPTIKPVSGTFAVMTLNDSVTVLSNGGLTVRFPYYGNWSSARADTAKTTGLWYYEVTDNLQASGAYTGLTWPSQMPAGVPSYTNATPLISASTTGTTVGILANMDNHTVQYTTNCGPASSSAAIPTLALYPFIMGQSGTTFTVNFGASAFRCVPPAGYNKGLWH